MPDTQLVRVDGSTVNDRILARRIKEDFRDVEAASLKTMTHFTSAEAKRMFVRYFSTLQLNAYFISAIARTKLGPSEIERVEGALRKRLEAVSDELNRAIDGAEVLFKSNGITSAATYDIKPLELEVGIISWSGRRFFEILNKLDQLMPLLQTLEIHELITPRDADVQRAGFKRAIRGVAATVRKLAGGVSRRMEAVRAAELARAREVGQSEVKPEKLVQKAPPATGEITDGSQPFAAKPVHDGALVKGEQAREEQV